MADVKISALPASGALAAGDLFAVVNGGVTSKATLTQVQTGLTGAFVLKAGDVMTGALAIGTGSIGLTQLGILRLATDTTALGLAYLEQASADTDPFDLIFRKARGTTSAPTVITTGDCCGIINFTGYSGAGGYVTGASIRGDSTGTIASTRVPANLVFSTGTDAAPTVLTDAMTITSGQFVGIGVSSPSAKLHVHTGSSSLSSTLLSTLDSLVVAGETSTSGFTTLIRAGGAATGGVAMRGVSCRGTLAAPTTLANNDRVFVFLGAGYDGTSAVNTGLIDFVVDGAVSAGVVPQRIQLTTGTTVANRAVRLVLSSTGFVGVGPSLTPSTNLCVNNSSSACVFRIYETTDGNASPTNYSRSTLTTQAGNHLIRTESGGSGTLRILQVGTGPKAGTDIAGIDVILHGGQSTGTGLPGAILFQQSTPAGGSGSGVNSLATRWSISTAGNLTAADAFNIAVGTGTGTKIGTATTQKLAFWNKAPIVQPTNAIAAAAFVANTSGITNDTATFGGYTIGQIAAALIATGILA